MRLPLLLLLFLWTWNGFSQTSIEGKVTEESSDEPIIFGSVALYHNDVLVTGTETDENGHYAISQIDPGTYDIAVSYVGYQTRRVNGIVLHAGRTTRIDIKMSSGTILEEVVITEYKEIGRASCTGREYVLAA